LNCLGVVALSCVPDDRANVTRPKPHRAESASSLLRIRGGKIDDHEASDDGEEQRLQDTVPKLHDAVPAPDPHHERLKLREMMT